MDLRPLGSTGLRVSAIGLGTVKLGRTRGLKYPDHPTSLPSDDQVVALLHTAADLGINLIDTAPAYGTSEERLGALMHADNWFGGRDRWVLSTKAGEEFDEASGESRFDFSPTAIRASVERSLRRLRTDHLEVVLLHSDGRDEWVLEDSGALGALRDLKREGKVRAIGASTKTVDGGLYAVRRSCAACDVVMVTYNPRDRAEGTVIDAAGYRNVGILVKKALLSGHLDRAAGLLPQSLADAASASAAALHFALARPGVSSVVVGTANPAHLQANVRAGLGR